MYNQLEDLYWEPDIVHLTSMKNVCVTFSFCWYSENEPGILNQHRNKLLQLEKKVEHEKHYALNEIMLKHGEKLRIKKLIRILYHHLYSRKNNHCRNSSLNILLKCCYNVRKITGKYCIEDGIVDSEVNISLSSSGISNIRAFWLFLKS